MTDDSARRVQEVVDVIRPLLAGEGPKVQGAVLADLVALFLAGHDPAAREDLLDLHLATVGHLVAWYDNEGGT